MASRSSEVNFTKNYTLLLPLPFTTVVFYVHALHALEQSGTSLIGFWSVPFALIYCIVIVLGSKFTDDEDVICMANG